MLSKRLALLILLVATPSVAIFVLRGNDVIELSSETKQYTSTNKQNEISLDIGKKRNILDKQQKEEQARQAIAIKQESERLAVITNEKMLEEKVKQEQQRLEQLQVKQESERLALIDKQQKEEQARQAIAVKQFRIRKNPSFNPVEVVTLKLERLIDIPFSGDKSSIKSTVEKLPVNNFFSNDVDAVSQKLSEIRRLNMLVATNASDPLVYYKRANMQYSISNLDKASSDYSRVLELQPSNSSAWINRGAIKRKLGDIAGAISDYNQAIFLAPSDSDAYRNRGIAREISGDYIGAQSDWSKASALGDKEASQWVAFNQPLPASQVLDISTESLIRMHSAPNKNLEQSITSPDLQASNLILSSNLQKIILAIRKNPSDINLLYRRGTELLKLGRPNLAILDLSNVIKKRPKYVQAIFNLAVARRQSGDLSGALKDYNTVIGLAPRDHQAYRNRGIVHQLMGLTSAACADWGSALAFGNNEVAGWIKSDCR